MPSSSIEVANEAVKKVLEADDERCKPRGQYNSFNSSKATIAKCALEIGVTKAIRKLEKQFPGRTLKESSIRGWVSKYKQEVNLKRLSSAKNVGGEDFCLDVEVKKLENKKRGRPLLLGEELDEQVKTYILALRNNGAVINSAIVIGCATGIVKSHDSNLLKCNGGHINITKHWALSLLHRLGFVKRKSSTKAKVTVSDFEEKKAQFLFDIESIIVMEEIPSDLVINWDHTGINYVPVSSWTMAPEGAKRIEIAGVDDKRQITAVFAGTMSGKFLPPQIIYKGKTEKCLPTVEFPKEWHITNTPNHWANEQTTEAYIIKILLPYIVKKRKELVAHW